MVGSGIGSRVVVGGTSWRVTSFELSSSHDLHDNCSSLPPSPSSRDDTGSWSVSGSPSFSGGKQWPAEAARSVPVQFSTSLPWLQPQK